MNRLDLNERSYGFGLLRLFPLRGRGERDNPSFLQEAGFLLRCPAFNVRPSF